MVGNDERIHIVILGQIRIRVLEFTDLLGIENMDMALETSEFSILTEGINQSVAVDGGCLHTDGHFVELELVQADTIFSESILAPPGLFCTENVLNLFPSGFMRQTTLFLLLTSMPTKSGFIDFTSSVW